MDIKHRKMVSTSLCQLCGTQNCFPGYIVNGRFGNCQSGIYRSPGRPAILVTLVATPFLVRCGGDSGDHVIPPTLFILDQRGILDVVADDYFLTPEILLAKQENKDGVLSGKGGR